MIYDNICDNSSFFFRMTNYSEDIPYKYNKVTLPKQRENKKGQAVVAVE